MAVVRDDVVATTFQDNMGSHNGSDHQGKYDKNMPDGAW